MSPGSHLLRHPEEVRRLLIEGISQAEVDCAVPKVSIHRSLREFMATELSVGRHDNSIKMIAHPPLPDLEPVPSRRTPDGAHSTGAGCSNIGSHSRQWVRTAESLRFSQYTSQLGTELSQAQAGSNTGDLPSRVVLAVGPEGGWVPSEVRAFQERGFQLVHLGPRILRTDIAVSRRLLSECYELQLGGLGQIDVSRILA